MLAVPLQNANLFISQTRALWQYDEIELLLIVTA